MDPIRNPYAPGAGQRPPELAGRDRELRQFAVTLERVAAGRPERSMVLSGLRGVGKTVLLNALRGQAVQRAWGTGKIEARPDQSIRIPVAQAVTAAIREVSHRHRDPDRVDAVAGVVKSFALRTSRRRPHGARAGRRRSTYPPPRAAPTAATSSSTWSSCSPTSRPWAATSASASRCSSTRCRTSHPTSSPRSAAPATRSASRARRCCIVGAGLPHLPVALAASKSYAERLFRYVAVDRLAPRRCPPRADRAGRRRGCRLSPTTPSRSCSG